ncbi:hypothetical protein BDV3_006926 [Batrachochytrium dendrobatidis]
MTAAGVVSSTALRIVHRTWIDYWERSPHYPATPHTSSWHIDPRSVRVGGMMMIWSNQLKVLCVDALMQLVCVTRFHEVDACGVWDSSHTHYLFEPSMNPESSNQENIYTDMYTFSAISPISAINDSRIPTSPISYAKRVLACDKPPFETRYKADQMQYTSSKLPGEADRSKVWQPMSSLRDSISFREVYRKQGFLRELPIGRQLCNILLSNNSVDMVDSMEQCNRSDVSVDITEPVANCFGIPMDVENPMDFDVYMDDTDIPVGVEDLPAPTFPGIEVDLMPGVRILVDTVKVPRLAEALQHLSQTGAGFGKILESLTAAYQDEHDMQQQQGTQNAGSSESFLDERPKKTVRFALDDAPSKPLNITNACDPVKDTLAGVEQPSAKSKAGKKMPKLAKQTELKKARGSVKRVKPEQVSKLVKQTKPKNTWSAKVAPTLQDVVKLELLNQQRDLRVARRRNTSSAPVIDTCIKERSSKKRKINCEVDADQPHPPRNPKRRWVI